MVRRADVRPRPADYAAEGVWPHCTLEDDAPVWARYALHVSGALQERLRDVNVSELQRTTGIARSTIRRIIQGETWPDVVTLAHLEEALHIRLWPEGKPPK
jgi:DNA-binding phage protein